MNEYIEFHKYHGCGNDFIMIDNLNGDFDKHLNNESLIKSMCARNFGIGADGLIVVRRHKSLAFEMVYFNADGKSASLCGNGARCTLAFARQLEIFPVGSNVRFLTCAGEHSGSIEPGDLYKVSMKDINSIQHLQQSCFFLDSGSPHYVQFISNVNNIDVKEEGSRIRYSKDYCEIGGTNVNFAQVEEETGLIRMRTYERGVENETLACGTGAVAVAIAAELLKKTFTSAIPKDDKDPTCAMECLNVKRKVCTRGGTLEVCFNVKYNGNYGTKEESHIRSVYDVSLTGPAQLVYKGMYYHHLN